MLTMRPLTSFLFIRSSCWRLTFFSASSRLLCSAVKLMSGANWRQRVFHSGLMSTPQNICMWMLPLSISTSLSSDSPVYDLRNIRATSPSGGNIGLLPWGFLRGKWEAILSAISFSGSLAWIYPNSLLSKLALYFCRKSNSVMGKLGCISEIFCIFTSHFF